MALSTWNRRRMSSLVIICPHLIFVELPLFANFFRFSTILIIIFAFDYK